MEGQHDELAALLAAWRTDIDSAPAPEMARLDAAVRHLVGHRPSPGETGDGGMLVRNG